MMFGRWRLPSWASSGPPARLRPGTQRATRRACTHRGALDRLLQLDGRVLVALRVRLADAGDDHLVERLALRLGKDQTRRLQ